MSSEEAYILPYIICKALRLGYQHYKGLPQMSVSLNVFSLLLSDSKKKKKHLVIWLDGNMARWQYAYMAIWFDGNMVRW